MKWAAYFLVALISSITTLLLRAGLEDLLGEDNRDLIAVIIGVLMGLVLAFLLSG